MLGKTKQKFSEEIKINSPLDPRIHFASDQNWLLGIVSIWKTVAPKQ